MNKKLLVSLLSFVILLTMVLLVSGKLGWNKTKIPDNDYGAMSSSSPLVGDINDPSHNFGCPENLIPIALANSTGLSKIFCVEDTSRKNLDQNTYVFYGYYSTYNRVVYPLDYDLSKDSSTTITCSQITVATGTNPLLVKYEETAKNAGYKRLYNQGFLTFIINHSNMNKLSEVQKTTLLQSNVHDLVRISVEEAPLGESGCEMNCCKGFVDIISVDK